MRPSVANDEFVLPGWIGAAIITTGLAEWNMLSGAMSQQFKQRLRGLAQLLDADGWRVVSNLAKIEQVRHVNLALLVRVPEDCGHPNVAEHLAQH
jgi:hypothetical protein